LALDLAIMLESYKLSYGEQIRKSERTAVEEKLTRAEHLAGIGQLAASLAHEIKNPLAGISGAIQIIRDSMANEDPHRTIITEILGQIRRLDATVKDLLQYARPTPPAAIKVGVDAVVRRVLTVLQKEPALQDLTIHYSTPPDDPQMFADDRQVEQLLINLIINAAHASQAGSAIHLVVRNDLDNVQITIRDQGEGMTHETLRRAFEPFFTTKAKGTGLGLSICRRIVEVHDGRINIDSQPGNGTSVSVTFPQNAPTKTKEPA
jgi:signal transduction histidine kinase